MPGGIIINGQEYKGPNQTPTSPTPQPAAPIPPAALPQEPQRKLGPTEFKNLTTDITRQFNQQGVTDINTINKAIEDRYISRVGGDIFLKGNTPTVQSVAQGLGSLVPKQDAEINPLKTAEPITNISNTNTLEKFGLNLADTALTSIERALLKYTEDARVLAEQKKTAAELDAQNKMAGLEGAFNGPSNVDLLNKYNDEFKIKDTQNKLTEIQGQIAQHKAALEQGLINIEGQPIALEFQLGQKAAIQRQAAATITALSAQGALVQGQLNFARDMVSQYYSAAQQDRQNEINRYKTLYELANDKVIKLSEEEKSAIDKQIAILSTVNDRELAEKDKITELMLKYPDAWSQANVSLSDDYQNIAQKIATQLGKSPAGDFQSVEVNGKLFTFNKDTGKYTDSGISVPKQSMGNGSGPGGIIKFTAEDTQRLLAADFTSEEIKQIQSDVSQYGLAAVVDGMDEKRKQAVTNVLKGVTPTQEQSQNRFITDSYIKTTIGNNTLEDKAKENGFVKDKSWWNSGKGDIDAYLKALSPQIEAQRNAGYSDKDILKNLGLTE